MADTNDFRDRDGKWVMTFTVNKKLHFTRVGRKWSNMRSRSNSDGAYQRDKMSYVGVTREFTDFQDFADWCVVQVGYENQDWQLDKDLLFKGNKVYSKQTCVFLPQEINSFISFSKVTRGDNPVGVCWKKKIHKFVANCKNPFTNRYEHLGVFCTKEEAFLSYKTYKENLAVQLANKWKGQIDPRAYEALMNYQVEITD